MDETTLKQERPEEAILRHRATFNKLHDLEMNHARLQEEYRLLKRAARAVIEAWDTGPPGATGKKIDALRTALTAAEGAAPAAGAVEEQQ